MKKKLIAVMLMGALAFSLAACGSQPGNNNRDEKEEREETDDKEDKKDKEDKDDKNDKDGAEAGDDEMSSDIVIAVDGNEWKDVRAAYTDLIKNMRDYVAGCDALAEEYIVYDYMYFDYDEDEENEVILYLGYNAENGDYMRDVVFMDYFEERHEVGILAISPELNDSSFYAEYDSKLARYSWITSPYESYLYVVCVRDGSLAFVLEEAFDYVITDIEAAGMHPLPLYGEWEIILPED